MVDASHGNSGKDPARQPAVARDVADQVARGSVAIKGLMLESFLRAGRQELRPGRPLVYGQSITDGCIDWDTTTEVLEGLAQAVRARRSACGSRS
jgi:3-deoxy-7-phosphoheptulonate synthase